MKRLWLLLKGEGAVCFLVSIEVGTACLDNALKDVGNDLEIFL